jgi:hypothetical protein
MSTLGSSVLTLYDWAKRLDPDGKTPMIAELLSQSNEILEDALFKEGNLPTGERTTIRTGLPSVYWRLLNQGTAPSKSTTAQIDENCGILDAWSEVDKDLAELNGNVKSFRLTEAQAFLEAMNQEAASTMFYGSGANPEEFIGLANRYSDTTANNAQNILSAGGSGADNSSVWLVGWGQNSIFNVFPKGSKAGLMHEDLGLVTVETTAGVAGNRMRAYQDHFSWKLGLVVKDWRYGVRIPNIDISDLAGLASTQATTASTFLPKLMSRAIDRFPSMMGIKPCFYANRTVKSHLRVMAMEKASSVLSIEDGLNQFGQRISELRFLGIPVRTADSLTEAESVVS